MTIKLNISPYFKSPYWAFLAFIFVMLWGESFGFLSARTITDMAGRKVNIPDKITRIMPYDNKTNVLLYAVAGDLMIAKARSMESPYLKFISKDFLNKKEIDTKNAEELIKLKPDLLIVASFVGNQADLTHYESFAAKVNIPLVVVDLELMQLDKTYTFLGDILHKTKEASICSNLIKSVYQDLELYAKGKKVGGKAYMANDNNGLRTSPTASNHAQLFEILKITNAAQVALDASGFAQVSIEQILAWNPDYVFCVGKGENCPYRNILKSAIWRNVKATKNKRVFLVPSEPYSWFDIPPSVNRVLGLIWFNDIFYNQPNEVSKQRVKDFYRVFYGYQLTDKEYLGLFRWQ